MSFESLTLLSPILLGCLMTFILAVALPAGFLPWIYNLFAIGYCFLLMSRGFAVLDNGQTATGFNDMLVVDPLAAFSAFLLGIVGMTVFLKAPRYLERNGWSRGEFYLLGLASLAGMMVTASTKHFTGLFLGIETMTIPLYFLMSADSKGGRGRAAAMKYLILGGVGSALLLYGIALMYGATGSLHFPTRLDPGLNLGTVGAVFLLAGFLFKIGAFPFQGWVPDVYGNAPTPVTGFMATGVKVAAFVALLRLINPVIASETLRDLLPVVAVLTMTVGNLMALGTRSPKTVLAYSSIAHTGYLLIGFSAGSGLSDGILLYLGAYTLMTLGAFAVLSAVPNDDPEMIRGLVHHRPALAIGFAVCILSLAGIPPLVGFYGKLTIFAGAWQHPHLQWLVIAGVINSLIALGYYIPLMRWALFADKGTEHDMTSRSLRLDLACALSTAAVVILGLFPGEFMNLISKISI